MIRIRNTKIIAAATAALLMVALTGHAQDVHFTQFFTNPLALNPAHSGYFNGNYRIGLNAKMQWPWAINPQLYNYHSEAPYVDFSFGEKFLRKGWMGVGLNFVNDQAGDGRLTYRRFGLSYAYHQALDKKQRYVLSAGVGLHYILRSVDFSKFYFNNQWLEDQGFDTRLNNFEPLQREQFGMFDLSAGLHFGAQITKRIKLDGGFSMLHINRPRHSFLGSGERLGFRYQAALGGGWKINDRFDLEIHAYYNHQKKASELIFGGMAGMGLYNGRSGKIDHKFYFGMYYRLKDALAPLAGYQFRQTRILLNYDITLSRLINASNANGGPELSLVHVGSWKRSYNGKKLYCPSF